MSDILDLLDNDAKTFDNDSNPAGQPPVANAPSQKEDSDFNYWENPEVKVIDVDPVKFKPRSKSYTICTFVPDRGTPPPEVAKTLLEVATVLTAKGYTFRHTGDKDDALQNSILAITDIDVDTYLPWGKFNSDIKDPKQKKPTPTGYGIAAGGHKVFTRLPNSIRAILARNANALLGPKCNEPVDILLAYTEDGAEGLVKGLDYKKTGNLAFYLKLAGDANIPVFNVQKSDAVSRLVEHIKKNEG